MIISYQNLPKIRKENTEKKIVLVTGSFDLSHPGHLFFFERSKALGDILVASVGRDVEIAKNKGPQRPVLDEEARLYMVDGMKPVDYAFLTNRPAEGAHWLDPVREIFETLKPDVYVINSDSGDIPYRETVAKTYGIRMVVLDAYFLSRGEKISTTWIVNKIRSSS